jgi:FdhD protein
MLRASTPLAEEVALAIAYNGISQAVMLVSRPTLKTSRRFQRRQRHHQRTDDIYDLKLSGSGSALYADLEISSRAFWNLKNQRRQMAGTSGCGLCGSKPWSRRCRN